MPFASLCIFTYACPVLSKCHCKELQRSSCGSNILPQRSSCAFIMQPQRSSWGFQDSSSSHLQSVARRTSSRGSKKKFLRMHYFLGCTVPISKLQCKNHTLFMTKMAKVAYNRYPAYDQNPYSLGLHIPIQLI